MNEHERASLKEALGDLATRMTGPNHDALVAGWNQLTPRQHRACFLLMQDIIREQMATLELLFLAVSGMTVDELMRARRDDSDDSGAGLASLRPASDACEDE